MARFSQEALGSTIQASISHIPAHTSLLSTIQPGSVECLEDCYEYISLLHRTTPEFLSVLKATESNNLTK